jgi:serine/threonine protein kinase
VRRPCNSCRASMCLDLDCWFYSVQWVISIFWTSIKKTSITLDKRLGRTTRVVAFCTVTCPSQKRLPGIQVTFSFNSKVTMKQLFQFLNFSKELENFLCLCLQYDNSKRPSIQQMLNHPFFAVNYKDILNLKDLMHISI